MDIKALTIFFPAHALKQVSVINSRTVLKDQILVQNDRWVLGRYSTLGDYRLINYIFSI